VILPDPTYLAATPIVGCTFNHPMTCLLCKAQTHLCVSFKSDWSNLIPACVKHREQVEALLRDPSQWEAK
jgi:hypothetical protein